MNEREIIAAAIAAEGLAQVALVLLVEQGLIRRDYAVAQVERLIRAHQGEATPINKLASDKLSKFLDGLRKTAEPYRH